MLKFINSKVIKPRTQFVIIYDGIVPTGYSKVSEFYKRCDDETLIYNSCPVTVNEYEDDKGYKVYPEVGKVLNKSLINHK